MPVVTMNGEMGSGGPELGRQVARKLGADYVDRLILAEAARRIGATVEALAEKERRTASLGDRVGRFLQHVLERSAVGGAEGEPTFGAGLDVLLERPYEEMPQEPISRAQELDDKRLIEVTRQVITDLARDGNAVIIGRASNLILKGLPGVLHVGLVAPVDLRVRNVATEEGTSLEEAQRILEQREKARVWFFRKFFKADPRDPMLYHLTVNMGLTPLPLGAEVIAGAARQVAGQGAEEKR